MTPEQAREALPDVQLRYRGHIYRAAVRGRKERFAVVRLLNSGHIAGEGWTFSWEAIARAASTGSVLQV